MQKITAEVGINAFLGGTFSSTFPTYINESLKNIPQAVV